MQRLNRSGKLHLPELGYRYSVSSESELLDCLRLYPDMDSYYEYSMLNIPQSDDNPLSYTWLKETQDSSQELQQKITNNVTGYHLRRFDDVELICYSPQGSNESDWKICLSDEALQYGQPLSGSMNI